ncbi:TIGR02301 family protein [Microvirga pudoricolor]|uniref:TIGR02301 family protein n=1 Tax=Microvirga pudoricolor TaxID=2778729 RepID=UPI001951953C|nr:TIGR02301 family protein [Microvirga pudoricolor]MBM6594580.1 TIGR02301 family protein [Microvirga pudoricolor]
MRRPAALALAAFAALAPLEQASAQNFFERLFGAQPQPQQPPPQQVRPAPQRRSQPPSQGAARPATPPPQQEAQPAAPVEPPPAPYEKEMLRLAEIMGALAFLRPLCTYPDGAEWPKRMQGLLEAEGTSPGRRERLAGAYNKGYQGFGITYRVCTPSAQEASVRYLREGDTLTRLIAGRYGG